MSHGETFFEREENVVRDQLDAVWVPLFHGYLRRRRETDEFRKAFARLQGDSGGLSHVLLDVLRAIQKQVEKAQNDGGLLLPAQVFGQSNSQPSGLLKQQEFIHSLHFLERRTMLTLLLLPYRFYFSLK